MSLCESTRADGSPCRARALPDRTQCWAHDGSTRELAHAARRRGGTNRSNVQRASRHMPRDMQDLSKRILAAFEAVETGELPPDRAHALARLVAAYVQLHSAGETDARIAALETAASASNNGSLAGLVSTYRRPS